MKKEGLFVFVLLFVSTVILAFNQPIIYVCENKTDSGTHIEIYDPALDETFIITGEDRFYDISFPIVHEASGVVGFSNRTKDMTSEVYLFDTHSTIPKKVVENAILEDISPDGKQLLLSSASSAPSLYLFDTSAKTYERITKDYTVSSAVFSPDGETVVFAAMGKNGSLDLYKLQLSNRKISQLTNSAEWTEYFPAFTETGKYLFFMTNRTGEWGVDYLNLETNKRYQASLWGMYPRLSPHDEWTVLEKNGNITVIQTTGREEKQLFQGVTPNWISYQTAARFLDATATPQTKTDKPYPSDELLISRKVSSSGDVITVDGQFKLTIPAGVVSGQEKNLTVYRSSFEDATGKIFEFDLEDAPQFFSKLVEIEIPLQQHERPEDFIAVDEIEKDVWMAIPSEYDAASHSIKFQTAHFSKKGLLNGMDSKGFRTIFNAAFGSFGTAGVLKLAFGVVNCNPVVGGVVLVGGYVAGKTGVFDPVINRVYKSYYDLNRTLTFNSGLTVSWVDNLSSSSHLEGEEYLICVDKKTQKVIFAGYEDKRDPQKKLAVMKAISANYPDCELITIPKIILEFATEMKLIRDYYKTAGYAAPEKTIVWVYDLGSDLGGWDGSVIALDLKYFKNFDEGTKAGRIFTMTHEYWHSLYTYNQYDSEYEWIDECLAVTFEGQSFPESLKWYQDNMLAQGDIFYVNYDSESLAESLGTGLYLEGEKGTDADKIKRGYNLWPWGKFLLATQGHSAIRSFLTGNTTPDLLASYFKQFCNAILFEESALGAEIEEMIESNGKTASYDVCTGWPALNIKGFESKKVLKTLKAFSKPAPVTDNNILSKTMPLSMNLLKFVATSVPEKAPLIIRRRFPDEKEAFICFNHFAKPEKRYTYNDVFYDASEAEEIVSIPYDMIQSEAFEFNFAIINTALKEAGTDLPSILYNPLYAYFLLKPENLKISEKEGYTTLSWRDPFIQTGLDSKQCIGKYNIYLADEEEKKIILLGDVSMEKTGFKIATNKLIEYDKIGVACVDQKAKDMKGQLLISDIAWISLEKKEGCWVKVSEQYSYQYGKGFTNSLSGTEQFSEYAVGTDRFKHKMTAGTAETLYGNVASHTAGGETTSFKHSWSSLPEILNPGQKISQTISVSDNGCSGKALMDAWGRTKFILYGEQQFEEEVSAGGSLYKLTYSWNPADSKQFYWTVPRPNLTKVKYNAQENMVIWIEVSSGSTFASYRVEYQYRP